ncbi:MAG: RDD family protein [Anaerolineales bacterium]|nr:MAG: RDD family protein [Anaerolineales bacterium]
MKPTYANPLRRLLAYWIDITLLYAVLVGLQFGFVALTGGRINQWITAQHSGLLTWGWIFVTVSLPMWLYFIMSESGVRQATLGKLLLGLKVTDLAGRRLTRGKATLRTFSKLAFFEIGHLSFLFPTPLFDTPDPPFRIGFVILLALMLVYFVSAAVTARHQSIHDFVVGSVVIRSREDTAQIQAL